MEKPKLMVSAGSRAPGHLLAGGAFLRLQRILLRPLKTKIRKRKQAL